MAEKRMFTQKIIDSDAFLDMPLTTQALYFHLNMRADDDGFINNPKKICRMIGASEDDLKLLIVKRFVLTFENGVIVIKHWRMHNLLRKDRYKPTQYQDQLAEIELKSNGAYTEKHREPVEIEGSVTVATSWQPDGNQLTPQDSIGKVSIDKYRIDKCSIDNNLGQPSYTHIINLFNDICKSYNSVERITTERQEAIERLMSVYSIEKIEKAFTRAEASEYLKGTKEGWKMTFDWIIVPDNMAKVLEGNYDWVSKKTSGKNKFSNFNQRSYDYGAMEQAILDKRMNGT